MPRQLAYPLSAPPLAHASERAALRDELEEPRATLRRKAPRSPNCRAIERRIVAITARLMALGDEPPRVPGTNRKDLQ